MIDDLERFLRLAAALEADAADGYARLAERMLGIGNHEVAGLFAKFGGFSRLHLAEVCEPQYDWLGRVFDMEQDNPEWPDGHSPENPLALALPDDIDAGAAMEMALETERRACDLHSAVAGQTASNTVSGTGPDVHRRGSRARRTPRALACSPRVATKHVK